MFNTVIVSVNYFGGYVESYTTTWFSVSHHTPTYSDNFIVLLTTGEVVVMFYDKSKRGWVADDLTQLLLWTEFPLKEFTNRT
jgi:hypothetical protein